MPFAEHNDMVKTIPSDRTDQPLCISVLPWRPRRNRPIPYTHCSKPLNDDDFLRAHWIAYFKYSRDTGRDYAGFLLEEHFTPRRVPPTPP